MSPKISAFFAIFGFASLLLLTGGCGVHDSDTAARVTVSDVLPDKPGTALQQLNQLAEQLYAAANEENRQLAYSIIGRLEGVSADGSLRRIGTIQGWAAFDHSVKDAKLAIAQSGTSSTWYMQAARLKLASDVLLRPEAPLWLQYEGVLRDDESRLLQAWHTQLEGHADAAVVSLHILKEHFERVEVAALMQREASQLALLKGRIDYTERLLSFARGEAEMNSASVPQAFQALTAARSQLFASQSNSATAAVQSAPGSIAYAEQRAAGEQLAILYISAIIMGILAFAGWRRFAYEQRHGTPYTDGFFKKKR
ncbi:sporulation protein YpjB [Paenibacillus solisilvae]|uniref:Sporulation protein YpjB n=1 Tax=Paenibacillus solisilvae TaxID=2486751 RepID=A0ABW0W248_9BACL